VGPRAALDIFWSLGASFSIHWPPTNKPQIHLYPLIKEGLSCFGGGGGGCSVLSLGGGFWFWGGGFFGGRVLLHKFKYVPPFLF